MRKQSCLAASLLFLFALLTGCSGFTVDLVADPDPADPGELVKWTVSVRNDTNCQTVDEDFPDFLPSGAPVEALIIGFNPELAAFGPAEFCRQFQMATICPGGECIPPVLNDALGPAAAQRVMAEMRASGSSQGQPLTVGTCETIMNDSSGFLGACGFDPLAPGQTHTAMHTDNAPDTGNTDPAQVAVALAFASGPDCRPGTEIDPGLWLLGGCFPLVAESRVPMLSPLSLALLASILFGCGVLAVCRQRRS